MKKADKAHMEKRDFKTRQATIALGAINIDPEYQRRLIPSWVKYIAENMDPDALGFIHLAERNDGSYWVIDGQHRVKALLSYGESWKHQNVLCLVYLNTTREDEAHLFDLLNTRKDMVAYDRFRARIGWKDASALGITTLCVKYGFTISQGPGAFSCVSVLDRIWRGIRAANGDHGPQTLEATLDVMKGAWGSSHPRPAGPIVLAIGTFLERYGDDVEIPRLKMKLAAVPGGWNGLLGKARGFRDLEGGTLGIAALELIRRSYNTGLRKNPLPPYRKELESVAA